MRVRIVAEPVSSSGVKTGEADRGARERERGWERERERGWERERERGWERERGGGVKMSGAYHWLLLSEGGGGAGGEERGWRGGGKEDVCVRRKGNKEQRSV